MDYEKSFARDPLMVEGMNLEVYSPPEKKKQP